MDRGLSLFSGARSPPDWTRSTRCRAARRPWPGHPDRSRANGQKKKKCAVAAALPGRRADARAAPPHSSDRGGATGIVIGTLERRRLIDEHDRNVVAHRVAQPARVAHEARFRFAILELALALRADENCEQLRGQGSFALFLSRVGSRTARERRGSRRQLGKHLHPQIQIDALADESSRSSRGRPGRSRESARPCAPMRIRFWLSRST